MSVSIQERLGLPTESIAGAGWQWACMLRASVPGIVKSFDPIRQTCVVQVAIQEVVNLPPPNTQQSASGGTQNIPTVVTIAPLQDVPIIMPRVPGWAITFPIVAGTECLLIFADTCIDGWWQSSGVQAPMARRRHDLSDAFALFGPWSQPNVLENYSTASMQIRSDDQTVLIDLAEGQIAITAPTVAVTATESIGMTSPAFTAKASGGTAVPLAAQPLVTWLQTQVVPFLQAKGYTGPLPPADSLTTNFEAQ